METRKFNINDLNFISNWLKARNLSTHVLDDLPRNGLIVMDGATPIAAGFIRLCEGNHGLFDSYITNPDMTPNARNSALDVLTLALIEESKALKLKVVLALTVDENTKVRSIKHGFVQLEHTVLALSDEISSQKAAK